MDYADVMKELAELLKNEQWCSRGGPHGRMNWGGLAFEWWEDSQARTIEVSWSKVTLTILCKPSRQGKTHIDLMVDQQGWARIMENNEVLASSKVKGKVEALVMRVLRTLRDYCKPRSPTEKADHLLACVSGADI